MFGIYTILKPEPETYGPRGWLCRFLPTMNIIPGLRELVKSFGAADRIITYRLFTLCRRR
jgi:hypothetical protein